MKSFDELLDKLSNTKSDGKCYCPEHYEPASLGKRTNWDYKLAMKTLGLRFIPQGELTKDDPQFTDRWPVRVTFGFTDERGIWLNPKALWPQKTMAHEIAHNVLGHVTTDINTPDYFRNELESRRGETEAEVVAFLVMAELDYPEAPEDELIQYILYYISNGKMPLVFLDRERVFNAARVILDAGRVSASEQEVAA